MNLTNGLLSEDSKHPDVVVLHTELVQLGFVIDQAEVDEEIFGPSTTRAVLLFQRTRNLPITGRVDEVTAAAINAEVDARETSQATVRGRVRFESGQPVSNVRALAYRAGLTTDELLGQVTTNQQGEYRIAYEAEDAGVALRVRVVNRLGILLATSGIRFNAGRDQAIDIVIASDINARLSQYEEILALLTPVVGDSPLIDLNEAQIEFLAGHTGNDPVDIRALIEAVRLSEASQLLSPAVFYAFVRVGLSNRDAILEVTTDDLIAILKENIDANLVPQRLRTNLDSIFARLEQYRRDSGAISTRAVVGRLLDEATGQPLVGFSLGVFASEDASAPFDVTTTDENGEFTVAFTTLRRAPIEEGEALVFRIATPDGEALRGAFSHTVHDGAESFELSIPVPPPPPPPTLNQVAAELNLALPQPLLETLSTLRIESLAGLQAAGGLDNLEGVSAIGDAARTLEAHVRLGILPTSLGENASLIEAGYIDPLAIAVASRSDFVRNIREAIGDFGAATVKEQSTALTYLLDNYLSDALGGDWVFDRPPIGDPELDLDSDIHDVFPSSCQCRECQDATSPTAYLADLLDYATQNLKSIPTGADDGPLVSIADLSTRFHQLFSELPTACEAVEQQVRQVRLCIEVLHQFLSQMGLPPAGTDQETILNQGQARYLQRAYFTILASIGTSFEELRSALTADSTTRQTLAIRLGLDPIQPDQLENLFINAETLTKEVLAQRFGLAETTMPGAAAIAQPTFLAHQLQQLRRLWRQQDDASDRPIIDPDLIGPGYLSRVSAMDQVAQLWQQRADQVEQKRSQLAADQRIASNPLNWLNNVLQSELNGTTGPDLVAIDDRQSRGEVIAGDVEALNLTVPAFDKLLQVWQALTQGASVLDSEFEDVINIMVQVHKVRDLFPGWRQEETTADITLSSDHFSEPVPSLSFPPPLPPSLPPWRANARDLRVWRNTLRTRTEQQHIYIQALQSAVDAAEEQALPILRNALVAASGQTPKELEDRLLIDCQVDGCQLTTRVAQAIETVQDLLWSVRTGQQRQINSDLQIQDDTFDESWQWLGSYATWRAAMITFLYPENVLLPSLRPEQTPAFQALLARTRSNPRLTPTDARRYAQEYEAYFIDVANLSIGASCTYQSRVCLFAYCDRSQKIYWSHDEADRPQQSFWTEVPGIEQVLKIVGAYVYEDQRVQRSYIYLFFTANHEDGPLLEYTRLNLRTKLSPVWDDAPTVIDLPRASNPFQVVMVQRNNTSLPPELVVHLPPDPDDQPTLYLGRMDRSGATSNEFEWIPIESSSFVRPHYRPPHELLALVAWDRADEGEDLVLFTRSAGNSLHVWYYNRDENRMGFNQTISAGKLEDWRGLIRWPILARPDRPNLIYIFWREDEREKYLQMWGKDQLETGQQIPSAFGADLERIAPHNQRPEFSNTRFVAFQRQGEKGGPFRCEVERTDSAGTAFLRTATPVRFEPSSTNITTLFFDNGLARPPGIDDILDGGVFNPPDPPPPPDDPDPPPDSIKIEVKQRSRLAPLVRKPQSITDDSSETQRRLRRVAIAIGYDDNRPGPQSNLTYLEEAYYAVPMHLALSLQRNHHFLEALDWIRTVYDYGLKPEERKIFYGLLLEEQRAHNYNRVEDWLKDPLTPHAIALTRRNAYTRYTVLSLVRCLLAYADQEFTRDTMESVDRARTLYTTALDLLAPAPGSVSDCESLIIDIDNVIAADLATNAPEWQPVWNRIRVGLERITDPEKLDGVLDQLTILWADNAPIRKRFEAIESLVAKAVGDQPEAPRLRRFLELQQERRARGHALLQRSGNVALAEKQTTAAVSTDLRDAVAAVSGIDPVQLETDPGVALPWLREPIPLLAVDSLMTTGNGRPSGNGSGTTTTPAPSVEAAPMVTVNTIRSYRLARGPIPNFNFCIPRNPIVDGLRLQAELNLYKIRTCRNIAGDERQLDPYAAPTEVASGLPIIGPGGELFLPGTLTLQPTQYRYAVLIERAKQLVSLAQQIEAAFLSTLEKRDAEYYQRLNADQEVELAQAGIRLQDLRVREAEDYVSLAELQRTRAQIEQDYYQERLSEPISALEYASLAFLQSAAYLSLVAGTTYLVAAGNFSIESVFSFGASNVQSAASGFSVLASAAGSQSSVLATWASYERREQQWRLQRDLARQDVGIATQQITIANDRVRIVGQERVIAETQANHARETVDFLANKFTNVELYDWMSGVLEGVYSFFLQQATATAQLAAAELAFERQQVAPPYIQSDYWEAPLGLEATLGNQDAPDRRGLTGSSRLLQDIYQLDQYAFETDRRKQQLTKTISLAQLAPAEFQRFRETGVLPFATPMDLFDSDFPGHYLRLIKRMRVSMIALIPSIIGIKATLASTGLSRAVVSRNGIFEPVTITRPPETISLSSPADATGLFDLMPQAPEMLLPFENIGVDTSWELQLPKAANPFDYNTIADVLVTIDYTALNSFDYRRQVVQRLSNTVSADRPFSFRANFADEWYRLNNPQASGLPLIARFEIRRSDFPPNLVGDVTIEELVLYFVRNDDGFEVDATLRFPVNIVGTTPASGTARSINGIISTRRGNASQWLTFQGSSPVGQWELELLPTTAMLFRDERIEDIIFVITYSGQTPSWPT